MRTLDIEYHVLRGGAFFGYLRSAADSGPTIRGSDADEIKNALSGVFVPLVVDADGRELSPNWLADEIEPVLVIDGDRHALGVFAASAVTPSESAGVKSMRLEAFDRCWRVRDTKAEAPVSFASGTNYITAVEQLLAAAGVNVVLATPTVHTLAETREWDVGTSYLTIINTLLAEINYSSLTFSSDGVALLEPAAVPAAAAVKHRISTRRERVTFGGGAADPMLPKISRETDIYSAPNVFVCTCANPDKSANMRAVAENDNPQSPLSISRRGRRIVRVTRLDNIADQDELQAYADRQRDQSLIGGETIELSIPLQPGYSVGDVVALHLDARDSVVVYPDGTTETVHDDAEDAICILRALTMELKLGGTMRLTLEKVVYNFD